MLDTSGLVSEEILSLIKQEEEVRVAYDAAKEKLYAICEERRNAELAWWSQNASKADLDNPDDLCLLASAAWDSGIGNMELTTVLDKWVASKDSHLRKSGWTMLDEKTYTMAVPSIQLSLACKDTVFDMETLAPVLVELSKNLKTLKEDYRFNVMENSCSYRGSFLLNVEDADNAQLLRYSHGDYIEFEGSLVETLAYIKEHHPYCSCGNHPSDEDDDRWDY